MQKKEKTKAVDDYTERGRPCPLLPHHVRQFVRTGSGSDLLDSKFIYMDALIAFEGNRQHLTPPSFAYHKLYAKLIARLAIYEALFLLKYHCQVP